MTGVPSYSTNPADNTTLAGLPVTDATNVNAVDDLVRQLMADTRGFYDDTLLKTGNHTIAGDITFDGNAAFNGAVDLTSATNLAAIPGDLGLAIGTDVQAYSPRLDDLSTTYSEGDLITADGAGVLAPFAIGPADSVLSSDGTKLAWVSGSAVYEASALAQSGAGPFDLTGIPDLNHIHGQIRDVSLDNNEDFLIQVGTGSTPSATGYESVSTNFATSTGIVNNGLVILARFAPNTHKFDFDLNRMPGTNRWTFQLHGFASNGTIYYAGGETPDLGGTLDVIRLTATGAATFDAFDWHIRGRK